MLGLGAGLGVAAIVLLSFSVGHLSVDCHALTSEECTFEQQIANEIARTQALGALGLALVATGLFLFGRRPRSAS